MDNNRVIYTRPYDAEVEYLESTGTQYIDTGFVPTINSKMDIELACTNENTSSINWMGCALKSNKGWFTVGTYGNNNLVAIFAVTERKGAKFTFDNSFHKYYISNGLQKIDNIESNNTISNFGDTMLNVYLFTGNRNFTTSLTSKQKIKYCKIYEGEKLFRDFIPVRVGSIGYMYDKVSGKLFGNKGTGQFVLGNDVNNPVPNIRRVFRFGNKRFVMPMPYDSKIEYLESNGNQYIDTGHILNGNDKVDIVYDRLGYGIIFGSRSSYNTKECSITNESGNNHKYYIKFGITGQQQILYESNTQPTGTVSVHIESGDIKVNETTVSTALYGSNFFNGNCFLFLINQNGSAYSGTQKFPQRIRSFKIEGILDFVSVRRGNVGYMYDKVSGRLFGNAGTGQFILGNDIND